MRQLGGCEHLPIAVTRVEWVTEARRTHIPPAPTHNLWSLEIDFSCESSPVRAAAMLVTDTELLYARGWADELSSVVAYKIHFFPFDWDNSDDVQIYIGGIRRAVTSSLLKFEPVQAVRVLVKVGDTLRTGVVEDVVEFLDTGWAAQVALIAKSDTKNDRTRWHVRANLGEAGPYAFMSTGRRSGQTRLEADRG
jgi:hypothetical protein